MSVASIVPFLFPSFATSPGKNQLSILPLPPSLPPHRRSSHLLTAWTPPQTSPSSPSSPEILYKAAGLRAKAAKRGNILPD